MNSEISPRERKIVDVKPVSLTKEKAERLGLTFPEDEKQNAVFALAFDAEGDVVDAKYMPGFDSSKYIGGGDYKKTKDKEADELIGFFRTEE